MPSTMSIDPNVIYALVAILVAFPFIRWRLDPLSAIPTVGGPSAPGLSYLAAFNFLHNSKELLIQGYQKEGKTFKVALPDRWLVVVNGPEMVDEIRNRSDMSITLGLDELFQLKHTFGEEASGDPFHVRIVREHLTRSLSTVLPALVDELSTAFPDHIPATGDEWVTLNAVDVTQRIVTRATCRTFVGLPLCRNQEYRDLAVQCAVAAMQDGIIINQFPNFLKPLVSSWINRTSRIVRRTVRLIKPVLDERKAKLEEYGADWADRPNDVLQWIIEEAIPRNLSDAQIAMRLHLVNMAAIHTSSYSLTHAVYDLAAYPEYIEPIREEVESIIAADGWTKAAMSKMAKMDSMLKESQRMHGTSLTTVTRKALKDITLRDGTFLRKGTVIVAPTMATHYDAGNYENPNTFDPFRFARMREAAGESAKHQFVSTSLEFIPFGHGRESCPGRFFASNELKTILVYLLLNYDFKLEGDGGRPEDECFAAHISPNHHGRIMFRRRGKAGNSH